MFKVNAIEYFNKQQSRIPDKTHVVKLRVEQPMVGIIFNRIKSKFLGQKSSVNQVLN